MSGTSEQEPITDEEILAMLDKKEGREKGKREIPKIPIAHIPNPTAGTVVEQKTVTPTPVPQPAPQPTPQSTPKPIPKEQLRAMLKQKASQPQQPPQQRPQESSAIEPYKYFDEQDERQMVDTLMGLIPTNELAYHFTDSRGRRITSISWMGIKLATRLMAQREMGVLSIEDVKVINTNDGYVAIAQCVDKKTGVSMYGGAEQSKKITLKSGKVDDDDFALAKVVSKAQRNALVNQIPIELQQAIIKTWEAKMNIRR